MPCGEPGCRGPVGAPPPGRLSPGKGRAAPAHPPFVRSRGGKETAAPLGFLSVPYRLGTGGRCEGGRPQAACLGELRVAGSGGRFARGTELLAVGCYWRPRWRKNLFATRCEATTSQGRSCRVYLRMYLYSPVCLYVRLFPPDPWDGSGWKRVVGLSRRATPEGREGKDASAPAQHR